MVADLGLGGIEVRVQTPVKFVALFGAGAEGPRSQVAGRPEKLLLRGFRGVRRFLEIADDRIQGSARSLSESTPFGLGGRLLTQFLDLAADCSQRLQVAPLAGVGVLKPGEKEPVQQQPDNQAGTQIPIRAEQSAQTTLPRRQWGLRRRG